MGLEKLSSIINPRLNLEMFLTRSLVYKTEDTAPYALKQLHVNYKWSSNRMNADFTIFLTSKSKYAYADPGLQELW